MTTEQTTAAPLSAEQLDELPLHFIEGVENGGYYLASDVTRLIAQARAAGQVHCSHVWNDFGQLGGRNVSWCPRCDTLAWTGKEPTPQATAPQPVGEQADERTLFNEAYAKTYGGDTSGNKLDWAWNMGYGAMWRARAALDQRASSAQAERIYATGKIEDIADELEAEALNYEGDFADTVKGCVEALRELAVGDAASSSSASSAPVMTNAEIRTLRRLIECAEKLDERPRLMCRDCGDEAGTCPNSGLECDMRKLFADAKALHNKLATPSSAAPAAQAVEAESLLGPQRWSKEAEMMESWQAAQAQQAAAPALYARRMDLGPGRHSRGVVVSQTMDGDWIVPLYLAAPAAAAAPAEDVEGAAPADWDTAASIANVPIVDDALRGFSEDPTGDNGVCVVLAVLDSLSCTQHSAKAGGEA